MRTLGILGGMGPEATVDVLSKIIQSTPAHRDQDHVPVLVRNIPQIPDRTQALLGLGASPVDALAEGGRSLRRSGAEVLAIACNTAHHWYAEVSAAFDGPVLHIAEVVAQDLLAAGVSGRIGVLATRGTLISGFYQRALASVGFDVLLPTEQEQDELVGKAIAGVKAGRTGEARPAAAAALASLAGRGAGKVVLGCTELPVALAQAAAEMPVLDANQSLAGACVRACLRMTPEELTEISLRPRQWL